MKFSANLTGLWSYLDLPQAIKEAAVAGFDAVECKWPYVHYPVEIALALEKNGLPMISLATAAGDLSKGESGLAALKVDAEAQTSINKAVAYAADISCGYITLLAGNTSGKLAQESFVKNISYASQTGESYGVGVLIEPLNDADYPKYFLRSPSQAIECLQQSECKNVGLLFDYYQVSMMGMSPIKELTASIEHIQHVSIASYPSFAEPDKDGSDVLEFLKELSNLGYKGYVGAHYRPSLPMKESLQWLEKFTSHIH